MSFAAAVTAGSITPTSTRSLVTRTCPAFPVIVPVLQNDSAGAGVPGAVEHIGASNVKRLLSNRYLTSMQFDLAHQLLRADCCASGVLNF